jgi:hypothetical protein
MRGSLKQALKQAHMQTLKQDLKRTLSDSAQYWYSSEDCRH